MSGALRKLERNKVKSEIKKDGRSVKRNFEDGWRKYREAKYVVKDEEGNVISDKTPRNTMPKKQQHFDNFEQYNRLFAYMNNLKNASSEEQKEKVEII